MEVYPSSTSGTATKPPITARESARKTPLQLRHRLPLNCRRTPKFVELSHRQDLLQVLVIEGFWVLVMIGVEKYQPPPRLMVQGMLKSNNQPTKEISNNFSQQQWELTCHTAATHYYHYANNTSVLKYSAVTILPIFILLRSSHKTTQWVNNLDITRQQSSQYLPQSHEAGSDSERKI